MSHTRKNIAHWVSDWTEDLLFKENNGSELKYEYFMEGCFRKYEKASASWRWPDQTPPSFYSL